MKALENQFLTLLNGNKQFIIPIYQRTYSWTHEQCEQLWNDIVRAGTDKEAAIHFVGSIVYIQDGLVIAGGVMPLLVIDGQQRVATLTLLLVALAKAARDSNVSNMSYESIYGSYLINMFNQGEQRYKLLLTQSDKDTLIALIDDPDRAKSTLPPNRLLENYLYFESCIRQGAVDPLTLYMGISKLMIVEVSLNKDHDNPQLIFESLNSTGMDLSQADLIRNYVLMGLNSEEQNKLYRTYWYPMEQSFGHTENVGLFNRFMRDYLTIKSGEIPNIDRVYATFKLYQQSTGAASIKEVVADIYRYSKYFTKMAFETEKDAKISSVLKDINRLQVNVTYPFLLEVYDDYEHQLLSREDFIAILKLVENYVFRRAICGIPSNSLNKLFATLAREIDKEHYLESVQAAFLSKTGAARFPRDEEFRVEFVVKNIYNFRNRNYLLSKLENDGHKEHVNVEEYTIEHILPQNEHLSSEWQQELGPDWQAMHARYLHTIGNLTLTGYNSEYSDLPFLKKRNREDGFAHSPIRLNESLAKLEHWNEEEIRKRAAALADRAVKIWPIPHLSSQQISKYAKPPQKEPLAEVIGPVEHPLAGFIPEGFKIVQIAPKKFHYFRKIGDEWVQYGSGKTAWYAISWETVGRWVRYFYQSDSMPLGVGGAEILTNSPGMPHPDSDGSYTVEDFRMPLPLGIRGIFERLHRRILNLDASVKEEVKKHYVTYKTTTNFVEIEPEKKRLKVSLNMPFSELNDPQGLARAVPNVRHFGNGDVEISLTSLDQIGDVMDLIRQAYERHAEEVYA